MEKNTKRRLAKSISKCTRQSKYMQQEWTVNFLYSTLKVVEKIKFLSITIAWIFAAIFQALCKNLPLWNSETLWQLLFIGRLIV